MKGSKRLRAPRAGAPRPPTARFAPRASRARCHSRRGGVAARRGARRRAASGAAKAPHAEQASQVAQAAMASPVAEAAATGDAATAAVAGKKNNKSSFETRPRGAVRLVPPLLPSMPPTVAFTDRVPAHAPAAYALDEEPRVYVRLSGIANNGVKHAFRDAGFRCTAKQHFNALWTSALAGDEFSRLRLDRFQKVNHFPGTWELGRKDRLYRNVARMRRRQGAEHEFDIMPRSFMYPRDAADWSADIANLQADGENPLYIVKPPSSSRGRGIRVIKGPKDLPGLAKSAASGGNGKGRGRDVLVQRYLRRPHLINGYKYDLRVYVLVTSFDPLRVYLYEDGLVRFATEKYRTDGSSLNKRAIHLTNYSINKNKAGFVATATEEEDGAGSKWSIGALRRHFKESGLGDFDELVWPQVKDLAIKCMLAVEAEVNTRINMHLGIDRNVCYELYGFDVVLDRDLRGWVLEANTGPALQAPGAIDRKVKHRMIKDMMHLIGFSPYDRDELRRAEEAKRVERLTGLGAASRRAGSAGAGGHVTGGKGRASSAVGSKGDSIERRTGRSWKEASEVTFDGLSLADMPACILDTEAEAARCPTSWSRIFPRKDTDARYRKLFEAQRYSNTIIARWLAWPGRSEELRRAREDMDALMSSVAADGKMRGA